MANEGMLLLYLERKKNPLISIVMIVQEWKQHSYLAKSSWS